MPWNSTLTRKAGMPRREKGLCQQSHKLRRAKAAQSRAYAAAEDAEQCWCSVCGQPGPTEHSHHYSQKHYPQHANDQRNWLVMGRYCGCHQQFENKRAAFAAAHPELWLTILAAMQEIDPAAFAEFAALQSRLD